MNAHVRDALVTDFEELVDTLDLPDPDDRHVLAAAIKGGANAIVTINLKDFPTEKLERWRIEAQHPDEFLTRQFYLFQSAFLQAARTVRRRLRNPPKSADDYLDTLRAHGLLATAKAIEPFEQFFEPRIARTAAYWKRMRLMNYTRPRRAMESLDVPGTTL